MLQKLTEADWRFIDCAVQALIALLAWIAIIYTRKTIGNRKRIKLKVDYEFTASAMRALNQTQHSTGISVRVVNLGMAPVYIEKLGLSLWKYGIFRRRDSNKCIWIAKSTEEVIELLPGKPVVVTATIDEVTGALNDKVRIYFEYLLGETYYDKKKVSFGDFHNKLGDIKNSTNNSAFELGIISGVENAGKKK